MESIVFIDSEITNEGVTVDLGAIKENKQFHSADKQDFSDFVKDIRFVCGHNIIHHDLKYIGELFDKNNTPDYIDTLYLSPLVFPKNHIIYLFSMLCMILFSFLMTLAIVYLGVHIANLLLQTKPFVNIVFFNVDLLTYLTISLAGLIIVISSLIPLLTLSNKKPIDIIKNK